MENTTKLCNESVKYQKIKLDEFKKLVKDHLESDKASRFGIPAAGYFADKLMIETADLENLVQNQTGHTAGEYIESAIVYTAKSKIFDTSRSINYTAFELGFKNIHHFTRLFKDKTGMTPFTYRETVIKHFKNK